MQEDAIGEVRGVADNQQNLEGNMIDIAEAKMKELPGAESYRQKSADMKTLTTIEQKSKAKQPLTKDDLIFLYEINQPIEGFGYQKDPRIAELRATRNPIEDAPIVLDCQPDQIAWKQDDITETTKAYIGPLFPGIFQTELEHIYTSFPEGKINLFQAQIGGKNKDQLVSELKSRAEVKLWDGAEFMLKSKEFSTLPKSELIDLVKLSVKDLGFDSGATTEEIYQRAEELGLEICPAEVGPHLRLQDTKQKLDDWYFIAMKQISDRDGHPRVFYLRRLDVGLWLYDRWARPARRWPPDDCFVFRRPRVVVTRKLPLDS